MLYILLYIYYTSVIQDIPTGFYTSGGPGRQGDLRVQKGGGHPGWTLEDEAIEDSWRGARGARGARGHKK